MNATLKIPLMLVASALASACADATESPASFEAPTAEAPSWPGPPSAAVAYFPFDGTAQDASGNGHDGALVGDVTTVPGVQGDAFHFSDGAYVDVGDLDLPASFTIMLWTRPDAGADGQARGGLVGRFILPGHWEVNINEATSQVVFHTSSTFGPFSEAVIVPDIWQHIAVTYDGGTVKTYVDGELSVVELDMPPPPPSDVSVWVGRSAWGGNPFTGAIDELVILDRALSAGQVRSVARGRGR